MIQRCGGVTEAIIQALDRIEQPDAAGGDEAIYPFVAMEDMLGGPTPEDRKAG